MSAGLAEFAGRRHDADGQAGARLGVLLVNTGTPKEPTPQAVKRYLSRFLMDPRVRPMNRFAWWFILHFAILPKRAVSSAEKYRLIWTDEGSPPSTLLTESLRMASPLVLSRSAVSTSLFPTR